MPDDDGTQKWQPPRGPVFRVVVWLILLLIVLGSIAGVVTVVFG